jgi:hypothetical protein
VYTSRYDVRMADTQASEAGAALARARWGDQVVRRAAAVLLERADELPDALREQVHEATEQKGADAS